MFKNLQGAWLPLIVSSRDSGERFTLLQVVEKPSKFEWTAKADEAFQKLKEYLPTTPILT